MWYVWFVYIAQLVIGTAFLLVCRYFLYTKLRRHCERMATRDGAVQYSHRFFAALRVFGIGVVMLLYGGAGLFVVVFTLTGPTPPETFALESKVLNVLPDQIKNVEILSGDLELYRLIDRSVPIVKPEHINRLCEAIHSAHRDIPSHPRTIWQCYIRFRLGDATYVCDIDRTENQGLQMRICPNTDDIGRWGASHFHCDQLRPLLLEITGKPDEKPTE